MQLSYRKNYESRDRFRSAKKALMYALQRINPLKFIDSDSQIVPRSFFMTSVFFNQLSILWFPRRGDQ
jgi:hypothetical protein